MKTEAREEKPASTRQQHTSAIPLFRGLCFFARVEHFYAAVRSIGTLKKEREQKSKKNP